METSSALYLRGFAGGQLNEWAIKRAIRRSGRVPLSTRLVITPAQPTVKFRAESQTINVSYHGARICTDVDLEADMQIRVFQPWRNRIELARVVWAHNTNFREYGIQIECEDDFWGIQFPADRWHELDPELRELALNPDKSLRQDQVPPASENSILTDALSPETNPKQPLPVSDPLAGVLPPQMHQRGATSPLALEIPPNGLEVTVTGVNMASMPFRESSIFLPEGTDQNMAYLWLRTVMRDGARVRVFFPEHNLTVTVRVRATFATQTAEGTKNKESLALIELPPEIYVSVNEQS